MRYLFVLLLVGCASTNWSKDGATKADLDADYKTCQSENKPALGTVVAVGALHMAETNEKIRTCLREKGWRG